MCYKICPDVPTHELLAAHRWSGGDVRVTPSKLIVVRPESRDVRKALKEREPEIRGLIAHERHRLT